MGDTRHTDARTLDAHTRGLLKWARIAVAQLLTECEQHDIDGTHLTSPGVMTRGRALIDEIDDIFGQGDK